MNRVDGKVALVTGAGSGIGRKAAETLAEAGARVMVTDIDADGGAETESLINKRFGTNDQPAAMFQHLDVTSETLWQQASDAVVTKMGGLDILVNNAGIECMELIDDMTLDTWRRVNAIMVEGVFLGTKYGARAMDHAGPGRAPGGSIINLSSIAGLVGVAGQTAYSAAKGAVRLFSKSAALEFSHQRRNIRVNSVHPGVINTPLMDRIYQGAADLGLAKSAEASRKTVQGFHPIGRLGEPEDIARAILYLASEDSSFMTGSELVCDGGWTAR